MGILKKIRNSFRSLRARRFFYQPLIELRIHKSNLLHNLHAVQEAFPNLSIAPVLKSNAYGHGLLPVAEILQNEKVPFLCVDSFFEALILRNEEVTAPLLILGYTPFENIKHNNLSDIYFSVLSLDELKGLNELGSKNISIQLKINTGMNRHGIHPSEMEEAIEYIIAHPHIRLKGIYTHLADADSIGSVLTKKQIESWNKAARRFKQVFPRLEYIHCSASSGALFNNEIEANVMRLGISLYGFNLGLGNFDLKPVLEMTSRITSLRKIQVGETVGYNASFMAERPMRVATIPVGYTEGLDRRLSNKGFIEVKGKFCPIIGRVSMNIASIDVTDIVDLKLGDEVRVISTDSQSPNSVEAMAKLGSEISYDILVHIPAHLRRVIV